MDPPTIACVSHYVGIAVVLRFVSFIFPSCLTNIYTFVANILLFFVIASVTYEFQKKKYCRSKINPHNKAVFITGCDSGFGHSLARRLDSLGFRVFAGCLFPSKNGALELERSCSNRLTVVEIDVTKDDSVKTAVNFVKDRLELCKFWALVNNAGILRGIDVELTSTEDFNQTIQVNALGPVRVTKAFLPLLRKTRGRIVNVNSLGGRIPVPHIAPYLMSKFAAVAFTESLRFEMKVWGIKVISVEPDKFRSPMSSTEYLLRNFEESVSTLDKDIVADYGEDFFRDYRKFTEVALAKNRGKPEKVIQTLEDAICLKYPQSNYRVYGKFKLHFAFYLLERLPKICLDYAITKTDSILNFPTPKTA